MIIHDVKQGTTPWLELRAGLPTASAFDNIFTKSGRASQSTERYLFTLLAERIMGHPIIDHVSLWMGRGAELEREALAYYEFQRDCETREIGFVTNDTSTIGASPDRFVGNDGCLEIKCPKEWQHIAYLLGEGKAYSEYKVQCQGQLWICERQWVDVLSYSPELPWALIRIERDDKFIDELSEAVTIFSNRLEDLALELAERGWIKQPKPREYSIVDMVRESLREIGKESHAISTD